jgi:hypothetical protein
MVPEGLLRRYQLHDRDHASCLSGPAAIVAKRGEDTIGEVPEPLSLGRVPHRFGPEREAAEDDGGVLGKVVVPGRVCRPSPLGRDDYHPIAVVKIERRVTTPCPVRAPRVSSRALATGPVEPSRPRVSFSRFGSSFQATFSESHMPALVVESRHTAR